MLKRLANSCRVILRTRPQSLKLISSKFMSTNKLPLINNVNVNKCYTLTHQLKYTNPIQKKLFSTIQKQTSNNKRNDKLETNKTEYADAIIYGVLLGLIILGICNFDIWIDMIFGIIGLLIFVIFPAVLVTWLLFSIFI